MIFEMPSRAAAVFIAFVLFWSAFATYGQARHPAPLGGVQAEVRGIADSAPQGRISLPQQNNRRSRTIRPVHPRSKAAAPIRRS
jgi:hypothetical protein